MNAQLALMGRSVPTSVTVRTEPSATTSTGPVCATRALRAPAARTASVPPACTDSSVTNTAPAKLQIHSGTDLLVRRAKKSAMLLYSATHTVYEHIYRKVVFQLLLVQAWSVLSAQGHLFLFYMQIKMCTL